MAVLLDTDILIDYLRGYPEAIAYLESLKVAATAEREGIPLVTLNARHFPMLPAVEVPYRKS